MVNDISSKLATPGGAVCRASVVSFWTHCIWRSLQNLLVFSTWSALYNWALHYAPSLAKVVLARTNGQPCSPSARPPISLTNLEQLWWCNMVSKLFRVNSFRNLFIYTYSFIFNSHCNCRWATIGIVNMGGLQLAHIHFFNAHTSNSLTSRVGVNW